MQTTEKVGRPAGNRGQGRKKGVPNKTTTALKEAILLAAAEHGYDGAGHDGLTGYLRKVATDDLKAFTSLLGRVLPLDVTNNGAKFDFPSQIILTAARIGDPDGE